MSLSRVIPALAALALVAGDVRADPCGMVPPISVGGDAPIRRDGAQRTYVSFRGGMETMALRPGFVGEVEEFGMLIPFPSPPAIRKIDDDTFAHIETAIDPPRINVQILDEMIYLEAEVASMAYMEAGDEVQKEEALGYKDVRVLREEAVGMYQVAVLEAGGAGALKRWMEDNDYRFPEGMESVTNEYVSLRWCFVAVKAAVGSGPGVAPQPGMRSTQFDRPAGSQFDGHVQGMAFRFKTDEPVVPMRLSVFNGADPRNVVYMLTDDPVRINGVNEAMVVRQLQGQQLHKNLTQPLQVTYTGGDRRDLSDAFLQDLERRREPSQYSHIARDLFAADLLAARTGELALPHEEVEKELLNLSEALGLRGDDVDRLHAEAIAAARKRAVDGALDDVKELHITVIDGVFPGALLAGENLTFSTYRLPDDRNTPRTDAIRSPDQNMTFFRDGGGGWWQ